MDATGFGCPAAVICVGQNSPRPLSRARQRINNTYCFQCVNCRSGLGRDGLGGPKRRGSRTRPPCRTPGNLAGVMPAAWRGTKPAAPAPGGRLRACRLEGIMQAPLPFQTGARISLSPCCTARPTRIGGWLKKTLRCRSFAAPETIRTRSAEVGPPDEREHETHQVRLAAAIRPLVDVLQMPADGVRRDIARVGEVFDRFALDQR